MFFFFIFIFLLQIYNDRRLFYGAAAGIVPNDSYTPVSSTGPNADRRGSRARGMLSSSAY